MALPMVSTATVLLYQLLAGSQALFEIYFEGRGRRSQRIFPGVFGGNSRVRLCCDSWPAGFNSGPFGCHYHLPVEEAGCVSEAGRRPVKRCSVMS